MSLTREVLSISPISLTEALRLRLSVKTINPMQLTDEDSRFLGLFLHEYVRSGKYYIQRGPWEVNSTGADGVKHHCCVHFTAPIVLRHSGAYATHLRAEVMGSKIGSGSYGKVYKALGTLSLQPNDCVTMKACSRIIKKQSHRGTIISNVERESELGIQAGYLHMKMPVHSDRASFTVSRYFADTVELFNVINNLYERHDRYSTDKILRIIWSMLFAVKSQLHDRGIISRDIKPENILVRLATEEVFNIDLGLSCRINECHHKDSVGSLGYAAPEVFSNSGMTVKSDIFSLGVTISLLLGAKHDNESIASGKCAAHLPDMKNLFVHVSALNAQDKSMLFNMLQSMMAEKPDDRMPIDKAISIVEGILLQRQLADKPDLLCRELNQAYRFAVMIRDELDLAKIAMDAYISIDPFAAMDVLLNKLKVVADGRLDLLPDHPETVNLFANTLQSKRFSTLTTKAAIKAMVKADMAEYAARKVELEVCINQLASLLESDGNQHEGMVMAQEELGLITTAMYHRVRSLAPTVDNLPVLSGKIDKYIRELRCLNKHLTDDLLAGDRFGDKMISIGLFRPSSEGIAGGNQVQNCSIPMKNI